MRIHCVECDGKVEARLTDGGEVYPHRDDLKALPFWKCDACGNHVGCHYKTADPTRPLGCIPNAELKSARQHIHRIIDPLWKRGKISRKNLYARLAFLTGRKSYHTANIRSVDEAREVFRHARNIARELK